MISLFIKVGSDCDEVCSIAEVYSQRVLCVFVWVCLRVHVRLCLCLCFTPVQGIPAFYSLLKAGHLDPELVAHLDEHVGKMEEFLSKAGTPYYSGSKPGFADYMIWPWFERIPMLGQITGNCVCEWVGVGVYV